MFNPKTEKIQKLADIFPLRIEELERIFNIPTNIYIDYANVFYWQNKLKWHIDIKRMKQFWDSFDNVNEIKLYSGELEGNLDSFQFLQKARKRGYVVRSKPVKLMDLSIDVSSVASSSTDILKDFIRYPLLNKLRIENVEYLNNCLAELNKDGITKLQDRKCNFDVEIGIDMLLDFHNGKAEKFILMSGDSDFYDPIKQLLDNKKKVVLFCTTRKVSKELNDLRSKGLSIYDIKKMRNFICFPKEVQEGLL